MIFRVTALFGGLALVAGCAEPPPPRSVQEFVDNPLVLEAALVRCSRNRSETRYEAVLEQVFQRELAPWEAVKILLNGQSK